MLKEIRRTTWTDWRGHETDIRDLDSDHIVNIIALLERRREALDRVARRTENVVMIKAVMETASDIGVFIDELSRRDEQ
jgi:hypothetical protein